MPTTSHRNRLISRLTEKSSCKKENGSFDAAQEGQLPTVDHSVRMQALSDSYLAASFNLAIAHACHRNTWKDA